VRAEIAEHDDAMKSLRGEVATLRERLSAVRDEVMDDLMREILAQRPRRRARAM
jgi:hypothetical protein